jgi:hypothetical protein
VGLLEKAAHGDLERGARDAVVDLELEDATVDQELHHGAIDLELGEEEAARSRVRKGLEGRGLRISCGRRCGGAGRGALHLLSSESPGRREDAGLPRWRQGSVPAEDLWR